MEIELKIDYRRLADQICDVIEERNILAPIPETKGNRIDGIRGLAKFLQCGLTKAQDIKNQGLVPFYNIGRKVFFYEKEVIRSLKTQENATC